MNSSVFVEEGQDYILIVWAPLDYAYGIFVASDTDYEIQDGYNIYCPWYGYNYNDPDGVLPNPLCEYECSDNTIYSIYSTVIPYT